MTSPMMRLLADRIVEEQHKRQSNGRQLTSVRVAPMLADALTEEFDDMARINENPEEANIEGVCVHGVGIEPDDDLTAMEFDQ